MSVSAALIARLGDSADQWFHRVRAASLGAIPCRQGCCRCCIGPFVITIADAVNLRRGLAALDATVRTDIESRAMAQADRMTQAEPRLKTAPYLDEWDDRAIDHVAELFSDEACPALGPDGSCRVYPFRPIACRTMGTPVESDGVVAGACDVQTFVPITRLSAALRRQEQDILASEGEILMALRQARGISGEDLFLPFGFLPDMSSAGPVES